MISVALAGNPNTGKTSLFNRLTGSYEYVGNWTGVTVEKKVGALRHHAGTLVDLPGVYSLSPLSRDEGVATHFLLHEKVSTLLNIVDASQLERNLYLTLQLLEYGKPLVIGLNMIDVARARGIGIDTERLSERLGCTVVPIVARTGTGCDELAARLTAPLAPPAGLDLDYGPILEGAIAQLASMLPDAAGLPPVRWLGIQLLEGNSLVRELLLSHVPERELSELVGTAEQAIRTDTASSSIAHHIRTVRGDYIQSLLLCCLMNTDKVGAHVDRPD